MWYNYARERFKSMPEWLIAVIIIAIVIVAAVVLSLSRWD